MPPESTRAQTRLQPAWRFCEMRVESFARNDPRMTSHGLVNVVTRSLISPISSSLPGTTVDRRSRKA